MAFTMWRGVVGLVRPTRRPGAIEELIRMLPEGIGVLPFMVNFRAGVREEFSKAIPQYEQYTADLAEQKVDLILLAGTPPFCLLGVKGEAELIKSWEKRHGIPIWTEPQLHVAAMKAMKIKKFLGVSYSALQIGIVLEYMKDTGLECVAMEPIEVPFEDVGQISTEAVYAHTKKLWLQNPGADGIYIHGGGWQTVKVVELLERDLQVPVVHAQACNAWMIHKQLMVRETMPGYGRLLAELP
jgi:maleate cis-trans isomerase